MIAKELEQIDVSSHLSRIRTRNEHTHQDRLLEVFEKCPEIKEIDAAIGKTALDEAKRKIKKLPPSEDLEAKLSELSNRKTELLIKAGYPADYLEPIYDCPICKDMGEINNTVCSCVNGLRVNELYRRSNLSSILDEENFSTFSLDAYSKEKIKGKELSPYDNAKRILEQSREFVKNFDDKGKFENILIYGATGLGKTFLANCISKELLESGHTVLYLSANEFFDEILHTYKMTWDEETRDEVAPLYEYVYNSDLLIIDDLGTEVLSGFVKSQLFEIMNKRLIAKRSTIITTNLSLKTIQDRYNERIISRIAKSYTLFPLYGEDIRYR